MPAAEGRDPVAKLGGETYGEALALKIDDVVLRDFRKEDLEGVLALRELVFEGLDKPRERRRWQWEFDENPLRVPGLPDAWVIEHAGRIVGNYGLLPTRISVDGVIGTALGGIDFAVDPALQGQGLGHLIAKRFMDPSLCDVAFITSPTPATGHLMQKYGGTLIVGANEPSLWVIVVSSAQLGPRPNASGIVLNEVIDFDARFDALDERLRGQRRLTTLRSSAYLNWRYRDYPFGRPTTWEAVDGEGKLRGFACFQFDPNLNQAYVLELAVDAEDEAAALLLGAALEAARSMGANELYTLNRTSAVHSLLQSCGFHRVDGHPLQLVCRPPVGGPSPEDWYVTAGDGDILFGVGDLA